MMINLTLDEANEVKGYTSPMSALHPIALKDGTYVLPVEVLDDPAHAEHHDFLNTLPIIADPDPDDYLRPAGPSGPTGATGSVSD